MQTTARLLLLALVLGSLASPAVWARDNYPKNPAIDVIDYSFRIKLSDETDQIECEETIEVRFVTAGTREFRLDLVNKAKELAEKGMTVTAASADGAPLEYSHSNNVLAIRLPAPSKAEQRMTFVVSYRGVPATGLKIADNKYGDRTFFSDNWPDKARNWLAVVDHPYNKATSEMIVTAPSHYQVVSNGLLIEETDLADGKRLTHWKQSVPIAPWLYVLGAARFAVQYADEFEGKSIQTWVFRQDRDAGFYDFADVTKQVLEFYSDRIGPFSYEKLANIQSNSVAGGMEAASAILYSDGSVTGTRSIRWRNVVIHEIAHQWFGNAVTEYDWDDVWLSEGFATYFTLLFIEHQYGRDAFLDGLESSKKRVDDFYAKNPGYRIVHDNLKDMNDVTSSQTYQKGSWVLHMLRGVMGTDNFWKGIRSYYREFRDKNATTADFRRHMEEASGMDLAVFFDQWLYKPGALKLKGNWSYNAGSLTVRLDQVQNDGSMFRMPLEIAIHYPGEGAPVIEKVTIDKLSNEFVLNVKAEPSKLELDPNRWVLMDAEFGRQ
jgi:aminopeptidase N